MATRYYTGAAAAVAQVTKFQITGYDAATTYKITMNNKVISTIAAGSANATAAALAVAWAASTEAEMTEETASSSTDQFILTANAAGKPFTAVSSVSGGTGTIGAANTTTANAGPEDYSLAANWSGGVAPTTGDTAVIEGNFNLRYGTLSGVTLARLIVRDFAGEIGLPPINAAGGYPEYRSQYMIVSATLADIMQNVSSSLLRFNVETVQTLFNVYSTGVAQGDLIKAFTFLGTHADNVLNVLDGSGGIATEAGEAATLASFTIAGGELELGLGCTIGAGVQNGGDLTTYANLSGDMTINRGTCTLIDDPDVGGATEVYADGTLTVNGGPTFTGAVSLFGGTLDLSKDTPAVTTPGGVTVYPGGRINDPFGRLGSCTITLAGGADPDGPQQAFLRLGPNKTLAVS